MEQGNIILKWLLYFRVSFKLNCFCEKANGKCHWKMHSHYGQHIKKRRKMLYNMDSLYLELVSFFYRKKWHGKSFKKISVNILWWWDISVWKKVDRWVGNGPCRPKSHDRPWHYTLQLLLCHCNKYK